MCACRFAGRYVHTHHEGDGTVDGEVNQLSVQQDLDQSPEEPKASVESEEGKHRMHITFLDKISLYLYFSVFIVYLCI